MNNETQPTPTDPKELLNQVVESTRQAFEHHALVKQIAEDVKARQFQSQQASFGRLSGLTSPSD